jgi:hypothetical protein
LSIYRKEAELDPITERLISIVTDEVKNTALMSGTATLFVRSGDDFVRVSTNVKLDDGARAVGTMLDPKGKAIVATRDAPSTTRPRGPTRFGNALQVSSACPTHCNDSPTTKPEPPHRRAFTRES